jgi:uncharacterized integral membrane protein (TIGR00697 family)
MNEALFIGAVLIDLIFILGSLRFGRYGLILAVTVNLILVSSFAPKIVITFGLLSNVGNIFYGSLFLSMNLILERYGKSAAYEAIWLSFAGNMFFITMSQFALRFTGDTQSTSANDAISTLFSSAPRIALASIVAYLIVQYFNAWFYTVLKERAGNKNLWIRYISSTTLSQFFDSIIFFSIAFFGALPVNVLLTAMAFGFLLKSFIGFTSVPFIYAAAYLFPDNEPYVD